MIGFIRKIKKENNIIDGCKHLRKVLSNVLKCTRSEFYMQYLGGKSRISKQISEVINEIPRREVKNCERFSNDDNEHQFKRERERVTAS